MLFSINRLELFLFFVFSRLIFVIVSIYSLVFVEPAYHPSMALGKFSCKFVMDEVD